MSPGRWISLGLAALLVLSFALRAWHASAELHGGRHYDERYSFRNVSEFLVRGKLWPQNAYYPSLSFLPQTAVLAASEGLHRLTGVELLSILDERRPDGYSATAYLLARLVAAIFGTLSIWLVFVLGRRLFSPAAGLLGATLLSAVWGHVLASALFKPDILVVLLMLATFVWSLDAVERPALGRFLLAGVGVGLATAAKYNGVGAAIPLTAAALYTGWRDRKQWLWLALAGVASAVTFIVLNPWLSLIFRYTVRVQDIYQSKAELQGGTHASMVAEELHYLVSHHGAAIVGFAVLGCLGLVMRAVRRGSAEKVRLEALLVLAAVLGYSAFYAGTTTLFRGQNYLPVTAFTALLAAWAMLGLWRFLTDRLPPLAFRPLAVAAWALVVALAFRFPVSAAYHHVVPSTAELAANLLVRQLRPVELRRVYYELEGPRLRPFRKGHYMAAVALERLHELAPAELDRADAEVFPAARLHGPEADFYLRRLAEPAGALRSFEPGFLSAWGPELVVALHGWQPQGAPEPLVPEPDGAGRFRAVLPRALPSGEVFSLSLWLPHRQGGRKVVELELDGGPLAAFQTRIAGRRAHYATARMEPAGGELIVRYHRRVAADEPPEVALSRWRPPAR